MVTAVQIQSGLERIEAALNAKGFVAQIILDDYDQLVGLSISLHSEPRFTSVEAFPGVLRSVAADFAKRLLAAADQVEQSRLPNNN
jgi:hypothetical protein